MRAFAMPNAAASRTVKESRYCKRLCSRRSQLHQQPSIRERPHADEAFTLVNTSVGALLNELVRSLGRADLRNAIKFGDPHAMDRKRNSNRHIAEQTWKGGVKDMGTTAAIIDSTLIPDRGSRDQLGREMDDALLRFRSRFCRSAFRYLGNAADAEDAVQDALLSAYKHLSEL